MTAVPPETSRSVLDVESEAASAWASRRGHSLAVDLEALTVRCDYEHPGDLGGFRLHGEFGGYRAVPPAWRFVDLSTGQPSRSAFPKRGAVPGVSGSIFHPQAVICAPWNRLAYSDHGGPHSNWSGPSNWLRVTQYVVAVTVADMLAVTWAHLRHATGRLE